MAKRSSVNRFIRRPRRAGPTLIQRSRAVPSEEKAMYHQVTGAGRSKVKRKFFDLNQSEQDQIGAVVERLLTEKARRAGA